MFNFVNYNKRTVTLPQGCKDLIDLLALDEAMENKPWLGSEAAIVKLGGSGTVPLQQLGEYVSRVCTSRARVIQWLASSPGERLTVSLDRTRIYSECNFTVSILAQHETEQQTARGFFESKGFGTPKAKASPGLPVQLTYLVPPLQAHSWVLSAILIEFFKVVCGLEETAELRYCYNEFG